MFGEGSGFCHLEVRSSTRFESTKPSELRFSALLSDGTREVRFERATMS
jgi:hypothetical protein